MTETMTKKERNPKPRLAHKIAFNEIKRQVASGETIKLGKALKAAGYSESVQKSPWQVTQSKGWKQLLSEIDDEPLMARVRQIALGGSSRESLAAIDMLLKLKDRYPAGKLKVNEYADEVNNVMTEI